MKKYIIAEAGVNHNGSMDLAYQLIDAAHEAGANAVKFQTFNTENLVSYNSPKADYQKNTTDSNESQFSMLKKLELSKKNHYDLLNYCSKKDLDFLSTAFDAESLKFLVGDLELKKLKISSGEINNGPFLLAHAESKLDLILSTGMSTVDEIKSALEIIAYGLIDDDDKPKPSEIAFKGYFNSDHAQEILRKKVTLLHCTSEYPAPIDEINLEAMKTISDCFGLRVGYSDHSEGILVSILAASMGAVIIEKHLTLDKGLSGPDHQASIEPLEFQEMVSSIRSLDEIMGDGKKYPTKSELKNKKIARKSLVASRNIEKGDFFTERNITTKRPGNGISPMRFWDLLGKKSNKVFKKGDLINE